MRPFLESSFGDAGRLHAEGRATRVALETAREQVATFFGARPREVVFTSSGTEAVNAAVFGAVGRRPGSIVTTAVEHSCVRDAVARTAAPPTVVGVDRTGRFDPAAVVAALRPDTTLVSIQLANHEVGTVQAAAEIAAAVHERGHAALVHVDACAGAGYATVDFVALGADLCSVTAHKFGGPLGAGALLVRRGLRIPAFLVGGAVRGGRVVCDWPGLSAHALYEGRDLQPTLDLRAVIKGVLRDHLRLSGRKIDADVFPDRGIPYVADLIRA